MADMSPDALRNNIKKLQRQLAALEQRQQSVRAEAVRFLVEAQERLGVTLADLASGARPPRGRKAGRTGAPAAGAAKPSRAGKRTARAATKATRSARQVAPRYRSPDGETWTGRGRPPRWLAAQLAQGRTREEFLITAAG